MDTLTVVQAISSVTVGQLAHVVTIVSVAILVGIVVGVLIVEAIARGWFDRWLS